LRELAHTMRANRRYSSWSVEAIIKYKGWQQWRRLSEHEQRHFILQARTRSAGTRLRTSSGSFAAAPPSADAIDALPVVALTGKGLAPRTPTKKELQRLGAGFVEHMNCVIDSNTTPEKTRSMAKRTIAGVCRGANFTRRKALQLCPAFGKAKFVSRAFAGRKKGSFRVGNEQLREQLKEFSLPTNQISNKVGDMTVYSLRGSLKATRRRAKLGLSYRQTCKRVKANKIGIVPFK